MEPIIFPPYKDSPKPALSPLQEEVLRLKRERNAVILAHNYVDEDIQLIADFCGDSLGLSFQARDTSADVIVFCGVDFMAETAKILNPEKTVLMPDAASGCSLEESCSAEELAAFKREYPDSAVVSYINCSGAVKAESDVICTSGNAVKIVEKFPKDRRIIFAPDKYLGSWVEEQTGRKMILWDGCCCAHASYDPEAIKKIKAALNAPVVCHPECPKPVRDVCDFVCSTEKMINWARENPSKTIIVATVFQMIHRLRREVPDKIFVAAPPNDIQNCKRCRHMDKNTLEKVRDCLRDMSPSIKVDPELAKKARKPIEKMLEWSKK
ncbi:MAG: quinolinate synthase NadA [Opitutales bacterium]|nr:quinolinate synthase NadA [Opitutales bacterium]